MAKRSFLPGSSRDRIKDLMQKNSETQAKLATSTGIDASTLSRFLSGSTDKMSHENIMKIASHFAVSTDFLLGETDIPDRKNYDIEELGLSAGAVRLMVGKELDMNMLNVLLEHSLFPDLLSLMARYLDGSMVEGFKVQNQLYDMLIGFGKEHALIHRADRHAVKRSIRDIEKMKVNPSSIDTHAIEDLFKQIVRDIKENAIDYAREIEPANKEILERFREQIKGNAKYIDLRKLTPERLSRAAVELAALDDSIPEDVRENMVKATSDFIGSYYTNTDGETDDKGKAV